MMQSPHPKEQLTQAQSLFGAFNNDGLFNASDAAFILIYAAEHGAGTFSGSFEEHVNRYLNP